MSSTEHETERLQSIVHETIELYEEIVQLGHSPAFALQLASSALTNYRLEIIALEIDRVRDSVGAMMAMSAIDKIRAFKIEGGDIMEILKQRRESTDGETKQ